MTLSIVEIERTDQTDATPQSEWPVFADIPEPKIAVLYAGNGSGTKLFQSFLDGHPQIYMLPAYPLMYLYPHWQNWRQEYGGDLSWAKIIELLCHQHGSIIDTRRIPGHAGLGGLGKSGDENISIDEGLFRQYLSHLLEVEELSCRTLLIAIHVAYAFCRGEDISQKRTLLYHIHAHNFLHFIRRDFQHAKIIGFERDPRSNLRSRQVSIPNTDDAKLNATDAIIYRRRTYRLNHYYMFAGNQVIAGIPDEFVRIIRHEDLVLDPMTTMRDAADYIDVDWHECMNEITFGGQLWWGDKIYNMEKINVPNPRTISLEYWQSWIGFLDWFTLEGLFFDLMNKYCYRVYKYRKDTLTNRIFLFLCIMLPMKMERHEFCQFINPKHFLKFVTAAFNEATGRTPLKDYSFHAYYRYKWTHDDLELWKSHWHVRILVSARQNTREPNKSFSVFWLEILQLNYIAVSILRYSWTVLLFPLTYLQRVIISIKGMSRRLNGKPVYPNSLTKTPFYQPTSN